jgi:diacylglycerol kinase family enzyme
MPQIEVIINAGSGSVVDGETDDTLAKLFIEHGLRANVRLAASGDEISLFARSAAKGDADVIVAGGGDGTIGSVAAELTGTGKILGVLPLGTLNNFSKDLTIPQAIAEAVRVIAEGEVAEIDVGDLNGRIFINNSSIGLYPRIVKDREDQQERLGYGKWRAAFWATLKMFRISPFLKVAIIVDGMHYLRKTPFVFVGNNRYEMDLYNIGRRAALDRGKLSVYFLHRGGRLGVIRLLFRTLTGRVEQWKDFEEILTESITIRSRRRHMRVALDGEVAILETPLEYSIRPKALRVLVPRSEREENADG